MNPTPHATPFPVTARLVVIFLMGVFLASCATSSRPPHAATKTIPTAIPTSAGGANWVKVRSNPPTWYPRGTPADCPTDYRSGKWVYAGDAAGTRYFIPLHGMATDQRKSLVKQWLSPTRLRVRCESPQPDWSKPDPKPVTRLYQPVNGKWRQSGDPKPWTE